MQVKSLTVQNTKQNDRYALVRFCYIKLRSSTMASITFGMETFKFLCERFTM